MKIQPLPFKLASILCLSFLLSNQAARAESSDLPGLSEMDGVQTSIATRTKLNIDYAPGTVNILFGEDMLSRGARIVWEALALVPGFESAIDETGSRQILVRGIGRTYSSGNIKILLNDIGQNSELLSLANPVLNMPLEQVERIEVIRGPGSANYGGSAYVGVVNVITRKQGQRVFAALGDKGSTAGGGVFSFADPVRQLELNLNLAGWKREGGGLHAGQDAGYAEGFIAASNSPGLANDKRDYLSALFNLNYERFSLAAQWVEDGAGDHFGINSYLPPNERRIVTRQRHRSVEARQGVDLAENWQAEFRFGWADYSRQRDRLFLLPAGVADPYYWMNIGYREQRLNAGIDLAGEVGRHTWLFGWSFDQSDVEEGNSVYNFGGANTWIDLNLQRNINSLTLQDQFRATDTVTLTAGLRHDRYSDVGHSTTPRLAVVWQLAPGRTLKAQYAEAFRAPTFYEINNGGMPSTGIKPETIATREVGYSIKTDSSHAAITVFDSTLKHLIVFDEAIPSYVNWAQDSQSRGVELEAEHQLTAQVKFDGNLSLIRTNDHATGQPIPGAASRLLNLGMAWSASKDISLDTRLRHVGPRHRQQEDLRDKLASYSTVDVTARVFNLGYRGLTVRGGIKNLFDRDVKVPSVIDTVAPPAPNYRDDLPMSDGRGVWVQATYSFD